YASAGLNYGLNTMEGSRCYGLSLMGCDQTGLTLPVVEYSHSGGACSVTGGYVYRGPAIPALHGHYFYSDYCAGWLRSFGHQAGIAVDQTDWAITDFGTVVSFGV